MARVIVCDTWRIHVSADAGCACFFRVSRQSVKVQLRHDRHYNHNKCRSATTWCEALRRVVQDRKSSNSIGAFFRRWFAPLLLATAFHREAHSYFRTMPCVVLHVSHNGSQVNPGLPNDGKRDSASKTKRGSAVARPGLMRTTFDEWDTLLVRLKRGPRRVLYVMGRRCIATGVSDSSFFAVLLLFGAGCLLACLIGEVGTSACRKCHQNWELRYLLWLGESDPMWRTEHCIGYRAGSRPNVTDSAKRAGNSTNVLLAVISH